MSSFKKLLSLTLSLVLATSILFLSNSYATESDTEISRSDVQKYGGNLFNSDWLGRYILEGWLFGGTYMDAFPTKTIKNDKGIKEKYPIWDVYANGQERSANAYYGPYMMKSEELRIGSRVDGTTGIKSLLEKEFNTMKKGATKKINITSHQCLLNGEKITGYNYLHGSNKNAGDFIVKGTATKDSKGNIKANLHFTWNDVIDPNLGYKSDADKVAYAKSKVPGADIQDYIIRIRWDFTVTKKVTGKSTWPFVSYK